MRNLKDIKAKLPAERRARVDERAQELILGEHLLRALREHRQITQTALAQKLDMDQGAVSRLEGREDFLLSTLNAYVQALGGELEIHARFPNEQENIDLSSLVESLPKRQQT